MEVIKNLLQNVIEDIDAGNSNISENDAVEIIRTLSEYTRKDKGISKYAACEYHNYAMLFKSWFGNDIEQKIIESAIIYWFKDDDQINKYTWFKHMNEY